MKLIKVENAPKININKKGAKSFVLSCIDPRFTEFLAHFMLNHKMLKDNYDLVCLAGSELGANQTQFKGWKTMLKNHIDIALALHNIEQFLVFSHMDCGAYKVFKGLEKDNDIHIHVDEIHILHKWIKKNYPQLEFKGFIMSEKGEMFQVTEY
jgi:hypothetical protein